MKIGVFDSGLGGLFILKSLAEKLPEYDYVYLGDTLHLPYGEKTQEAICALVQQGIEYLLQQDCALVIVACNTASAEALRYVQQKYLPMHYPERRVLGVIIPAIEESLGTKRVGVLGTTATVESRAYEKEFKKTNPDIEVFQQAAPLLVPYIENGQWGLIPPVLEGYLQPLLEKEIDTLVLGCTHYPLVKNEIREIIGPKIRIVSQDEFLHKKVADYLERHPEIKLSLSQNRTKDLNITKTTEHFQNLTRQWFGTDIEITVVKIPTQ